jgi:geranylgeranyl diphosphate synthase type I
MASHRAEEAMAVAVHPAAAAGVDGSPADVAGLAELVGRAGSIQTVESTLVDFLSREVAALEATDPELGRFGHVASDWVLAGGKRLRPTFAYWGWRGLVGLAAPLAPVLPALAALELLHAFALAQDDVMDGSATRRGRPTVHRVLADQHVRAGRTGDPDRFGAAAAVLAGDLCLVWADRLLGTAALPARVLLDARCCYDQMRIDAIAGQYLDILGETDAGNWSVERALLAARLKTASYTVRRPLMFGAALSGRPGDARVTATYDAYGVAVGEAFQLRDDLLGVYGAPAVTGKPVGDDLRTGKPTALLLTAERLATPAQRAALDQALACASRAGDVDLGRLADLIADTGAVDEMERMIHARVVAALAILSAAPIDPTASDALAELAVAVTHRRT